MADVYAQHRAAFRGVMAYALIYKGQHVGSVAVKVGATVQAYVHLQGFRMARGVAKGCGYDKASAAVETAIEKMEDAQPGYHTDHMKEAREALRQAATLPDGWTWTTKLAKSGFDVYAAIA